MNNSKTKTPETRRTVQWYRIDESHKTDRVNTKDVATHITNAYHLDHSAATAQVEQALFSRTTIVVDCVTYKPCELRITLSPQADPDCYDFQNIYRSINHNGFTIRVNGVDYEVTSSDPLSLRVRPYDQRHQRTLSCRIEKIAWTEVDDLYIY